MSDSPPGKQSKKSRLFQPFKGLLSKRSRSPSRQVAHSVNPDNASASISASATSAPQVNSQITEYTAILELSTTPSGSLTWEHRMKEWKSTAYEGLKTAIQGIYDCSSIFPPLNATARVLLTISKAVDVSGSMCSSCNALTFGFAHQRVSANRTDLQQLEVKLRSILSIIGKYRENGGLRALDNRVETFCLLVESSFVPCLFGL